MKSFVLAAGLATLLGSAAFAQTATTTVPATTATTTNDVIVVLPQAAAGSAPARFLADDLEGEDIYGANNEEIGEIEDFVMRPDGSVEAVVVEVGGFLGVGEKDVLVSWSALQIGVQDNDLRITAPGLTRDILQNAQGVDLDTLVLGRD